MSPEERSWLAGLLEGEGSFTATRRVHLMDARVSLEMTDPDIVARAAHLMGARMNPKPRRRDAQPHWKPQYYATIGGRRAIDLMKELLPWMGARRSARIGELTSTWFESRTFVCRECGRDFFLERKGGKPAQTCSEFCRRADYNKYRSAWRAARKEVAA